MERLHVIFDFSLFSKVVKYLVNLLIVVIYIGTRDNDVLRVFFMEKGKQDWRYSQCTELWYPVWDT